MQTSERAPSERASSGATAAHAALIPALRLLREVGMGPVADAARERASWPAPPPTVVVLGEPGRGVSSVVRLLAPHETDPPTPATPVPATPHHLAASLPDPSATVYRRLVPPTQALDGPARLVAHPDAPGEAPIVMGVDLPWSQCVLGPEVTVIDVPCSGGLDGPRAAMARALVADATMALFVTDAGAPLSRPELDYLRGLVIPSATLVVLVNRIDIYPDTWLEVVKQNAALLRAHDLPFASIRVLGFSCALADYAQHAPQAGYAAGQAAQAASPRGPSVPGDPVMAARLRAASGWDELLEILGAGLERASLAPQAGALLGARAGLLEHRAIVHRAIDLAGESDARIEGTIAAAAQSVAAAREQAANWPALWQREVVELRYATHQDARERLDRWRTESLERLSTTRNLHQSQTAEALAGDMMAELVTLRREVLAAAHEKLTSALRQLLQTSALPHTVSGEVPATVSGPRAWSAPMAARGQPLQTLFAFNIGASMSGAALGTAASLVGVPTVASGGLAAVPVLIGLGVMALTKRTRAETNAQAHFRTELSALARSEHEEIMRTHELQMARLGPDLSTTLREHFTHQVHQAQEWLTRAQETRSASHQEQQRVLSRARDLQVVIDQQVHALDEALATLLT